jgi:asparagine synthetase B (glutamine-hydrolysing)
VRCELLIYKASYAKASVELLGTDHTELYVAPQTALELIPNLAEWVDVCRGLQIPTLVVAEFARGHVTVAHSDEGGDELFYGSPWYQFGVWLFRMQRRTSRRSAGSRRPVIGAIPCNLGLSGHFVPGSSDQRRWTSRRRRDETSLEKSAASS